jgi:hypothetical protein
VNVLHKEYGSWNANVRVIIKKKNSDILIKCMNKEAKYQMNVHIRRVAIHTSHGSICSDGFELCCKSTKVTFNDFEKNMLGM